jgi:serine/threonine protein kinase
MGEVYRARDVRLDRDVALKVLPDSFASSPNRLDSRTGLFSLGILPRSWSSPR